MSLSIINELSGIIIDQNQRPVQHRSGASVAYQQFFLPASYQRGSGSEAITPPLTGIGLFAQVTSTVINLIWSVEYQVYSIGWVEVASGVETAASHIGDRVWITCPFDKPASIDTTEALRFRIKFQATAGISGFWYSTPNPYETPFAVHAFDSDGVTVLQDAGKNIAYSFRVLALTADEGIDFLGNSYRSAVSFNDVGNVSTLDGEAQDRYWLSKPNPSRFAVENMYFDMRPKQEAPIYTRRNWVTNPSVENGLTAPHTATAGGTGSSISNYSVITSDFYAGSRCLKFAGTAGTSGPVTLLANSGVTNIPCRSGQQVFLRAAVKVVTGAPTNITLKARGFDITGGVVLYEATVATLSSIVNGRWYEMSGFWTVPSDSYSVLPEVLVAGMGSTAFEIHYDAFMIEIDESGPHTYYDGSFPGCAWTAGPYTQSVTMEFLDPADDSAVIDRVLVDPLTPGIFFSIYYTEDGLPGATPDEWDGKLWTKVPGTFHATKRETHVLPSPIRAKYIKLEFTHLQARSYSPGNFSKPVLYQKHPKWVLDYFLARLEADKASTSALDVSQVAVVFDAYDLAYNYYLDDLDQTPTTPFEVDPRFRTAVASYLATTNDLSDRLDPSMLDKIKVSLQPYRDHISSFANPETILGGIVQGSLSSSIDYPVESSISSATDIRQLRNESVVFENNYPVMFFYLTCRHAYRQISATFDNDKAYFAGIRNVAFTREKYTVAFDNALYIEPHGDLLNTERNDFSRVEGRLVV